MAQVVDGGPEFARRLNKALDGHPEAPKGHGRQTWLAKTIGVADETVRKWFKGEAIPKYFRMLLLADLLHKSPGWLHYGSYSRAANQKKIQDRKVRAMFGAIFGWWKR